VCVTDTLLQAQMITISWSRANKEQLVPANVLVPAYFSNSRLSLRFSVHTARLRFLAVSLGLTLQFLITTKRIDDEPCGKLCGVERTGIAKQQDELAFKATKATSKAMDWFHFAFTFVKSMVGKQEWGIPPLLSIKKGVELQCSD